MEIAKAALIGDISIYNLEGILRSDSPDAWFEALVHCQARVPERSLRVDAARSLSGLLTRVL